MADLEMNILLATAVHEAKNMMGELSVRLDDYYRQHPDPEMESMRSLSRALQDRLLQILILQNEGGDHLVMNTEAINPAELLDEVFGNANLFLPKGMILELNSAVDDVPFWFIDRYLTSHVLMNALHNAIKFAGSRIVLDCREEAGGLLFTVQDDGPGYPDRPGFEQDPTLEESKRGTGLGLRFNECIAAAHGGKISRSNDAGACFALWLPR